MAQLFKRKPQQPITAFNRTPQNTQDVGANLPASIPNQPQPPVAQQSTLAQNEAARHEKFLTNEAASANNPKNDPLFLQKRVAAQIEPNNQQAAQMQGDIASQNTALTQANDLQLANRDLAQRQSDIQAAQDQPLPQSQFNLGQGSTDLAANVGTNISSIGAGVAGGAVLGAVGGPVGSVVGGIIGGVSAFLGKLAVDRRQATKEALKLFLKSSGTRNTQILNMAHAGVPAGDVIRAYNQNLANIQETERELKAQTKTAIGRKLSAAMDEQIQVELYLDNEDFYRQQLMIALANPNPAKIQPIPQDLNIEGG